MDRDEALDLYKIAVDEYRYQVTLNWQRTQYYLALNGALLAAGTGLLQAVQGRLNILVALLFVSGVASCTLSILASLVQHAYYRAARDGKARLEAELKLGEFAIRTTVGMGGAMRRFGTVRGYNICLLVVLAGADIAGVAFAVYRLSPH